MSQYGYNYPTGSQRSEHMEKAVGFNVIAVGMAAYAFYPRLWIIPVGALGSLILTALCYKRALAMKILSAVFGLCWGGLGWVIGKQLMKLVAEGRNAILLSIVMAVFWMAIGILLNCVAFQWFKGIQWRRPKDEQEEEEQQEEE